MSLPTPLAAPAATLDARCRRRRARLRCRRARRRARRPPGPLGADRHQGHPRRRAHRVGPGWPRRRARPAGLAREPRRATRSRRAPGCATSTPCAQLVAEAPEGDPLPDGARRDVRPGCTTVRRRSPARAGTRTTGSSMPAATRAAPRSSARSTRRRSRPGSRCSTGRSRSTSWSEPGGGRRAARLRRADRPDRRARAGVVGRASSRARAVVLATGGYGQVFASTSNPPAVTGDGLALAARAGLPLRDVEFVQFHPTVLWRGADATGQQALISEAVRGEGRDPVRRARPAGDGRGPPAGGSRAARRRRRGDQPADGRGAGRRSATTCSSTPRTWASGSTNGSRRSPRPASRPGSTRPPTGSRSPRRRTTPVAGSSPTSTAAPSMAGLYAGRRGGLHRRARSQSAGVELADRGGRRRHPGRADAGSNCRRRSTARRRTVMQ